MNTNQIARIAGLIGDPARATMLMALMDGKALTATELARAANITPQTASGHLSQLVQAALLKVQKQGRHRYHSLASAQTARLLENIQQIATLAQPPRPVVTGPRDQAMRQARTCYDHFAGRLGVAISDSLLSRKVIEFDDDAGAITESGQRFLKDAGIIGAADPGGAHSKRVMCRPCLDWSERRPHVAGRLGAAICTHFMRQGYVRRIRNSRALRMTPAGNRALFELFGLSNID